MTIKLTFEFATEDEALRFLTRDKAQPAEAPKPKAKRTTPPATAPVEDAAPEVKFVAPEVKPEPVKAVPKLPNTPVQAVAEVNEAAVRAALREVVNTKSMKVAADILKEFGAASISQIKPEDFGRFITACGK